MSRLIGLLVALSACAPEYRPAEEYCERTVDAFCGYYLRCDRIVAASPEECENTFLETCNAVYEPHYVALEAEGLLALSTDGMKACEAHLAEVACDDQLTDLQGGCDAMWEGQAGSGDACGLGIESFVCDAATTCVIGLDLCGTCQPAKAVGEACGEGDRCRPPGECVEGTCVAAGLPGDACDDDTPCVLGAWCEEGACVAPAIVGVGDDCDVENRCPYKSACIGGVCVESGLHGESCGNDRICASGFCDEGTCAPLRAAGEACEQAFQCAAGSCDEVCGALPGVCFE